MGQWIKNLCGKHEELSSEIQIPRTQGKSSEASTVTAVCPLVRQRWRTSVVSGLAGLAQTGKPQAEKGAMTQ